jgi:hypothetical protein
MKITIIAQLYLLGSNEPQTPEYSKKILGL